MDNLMVCNAVYRVSVIVNTTIGVQKIIKLDLFFVQNFESYNNLIYTINKLIIVFRFTSRYIVISNVL